MRRLVILLVAAAAATACGSSGGAQGLTKAEYTSKANDICKLYRIKLVNDAKQTRGLTDLAQRAKIDRASFVKDVRAEISALKALDPPKADKKKVNAAIDQLKAAVDDLDGKLKSNPKAAYAADYDPFAHGYSGLNRYGATQCG